MQVSDCKPVGVEVDGGGISPLDGLRFGDRYRGSELGEPPPGCQSLERKVMQFGSLLCSSLVLALTASLSPLPSGIDLVIITILLFFPSSLSPFFRRYSIHNSIQSGKDGTIA